MDKSVLEVVIENEKIIQGIYKNNDEELFLYDVNINGENERDVIENIENYLKKVVITIYNLNIYN